LKDLGAHPETGESVRVLAGRFGPYIASGGVNANVPRGTDPAELTMDQAVTLLAERAAKGGGKKPVKKAPVKKVKAAPKSKTATKTKASAKVKPAAKKKSVAA
jgi:DNA topoisomerase-1